MNLVKRITVGLLVAGGAFGAWAGSAMAEGNAEGTTSEGWVASDINNGDWQRRVLQHGPTTHSGPEQARVDQQRALRWSRCEQNPVRTAARTASRTVSAEVLPAPEEIPLGTEEPMEDPLPADVDAYEPLYMGGPELYAPGASDGCGGAVSGCGGHPGGLGSGFCGVGSEWWARDLSLFAGGHGFKGPFDQGRNGNFGLHEGVNFGSALGGPAGWGYQVGFAAVQSNFAGDQATGQVRRGDRDQFFFTAGIFHRALPGGVQWGVAFDLLRDTYYANADLKQLRTEIGYIVPGGQGEIGYFGAYGVDDDEVVVGQTSLSLEPTDMFAFYYRRHFDGGGQGRLWGGFTGQADGLLGADLRVPLGRSWAIENSFNYLIPRQGRGALGQAEESWGVSVRLVWYLGQPARCATRSPHHPLMNVADNSLFMFDAFSR